MNLISRVHSIDRDVGITNQEGERKSTSAVEGGCVITDASNEHCVASPPLAIVERSLERNEARRVRGADTRSTVLDRLVRDRKLAQVVADHLGLDLHLQEGNIIKLAILEFGAHLIELLAVVDADDATDHLRQHDHVA